MLSLSSTSASAAALDRADSSARAAARAGAKPEEPQADAGVAAHAQAPGQRVEAAVPGVADGLSTVAAIGVTVGSIPAALCRMRDIAVASNSGTLSDTERAKLHSEYMDLNLQVVSVIGESGRSLAVTATQDAASSQDQPHGGQQPAGDGSGPASQDASDGGPHAASPSAAEAAAAAPAAPPSTPHRIEAARPAVLAQFRQQAAAPRTHFSVRA